MVNGIGTLTWAVGQQIFEFSYLVLHVECQSSKAAFWQMNKWHIRCVLQLCEICFEQVKYRKGVYRKRFSLSRRNWRKQSTEYITVAVKKVVTEVNKIADSTMRKISNLQRGGNGWGGEGRGGQFQAWEGSTGNIFTSLLLTLEIPSH